MITSKFVTHDLDEIIADINLLDGTGDEIADIIRNDFDIQLNAGLKPDPKNPKGNRRSGKSWDTLARRLWGSFTNKYHPEHYEKVTASEVVVGSNIPYALYQARAGRELGITDRMVLMIMNLLERKLNDKNNKK